MVPSSGYLKIWDLTPYRNGALLRVPDRHHPEQLAPFHEQPKTFEVFSEAIKWNSIMGLDNVGDVNKACLDGKATDLIQVAEALQEKKIVQIAEEINKRYRSPQKVRIVLITGPTSSGKSTFCKRLSVQLMTCGLHRDFALRLVLLSNDFSLLPQVVVCLCHSLLQGKQGYEEC